MTSFCSLLLVTISASMEEPKLELGKQVLSRDYS